MQIFPYVDLDIFFNARFDHANLDVLARFWYQKNRLNLTYSLSD